MRPTAPGCEPGVPVSHPVDWSALDEISPSDFTIRTVPAMRSAADPWIDLMPPPQRLAAELIDEGRQVPIARVAAMHEGKRRARARREAGEN